MAVSLHVLLPLEIGMIYVCACILCNCTILVCTSVHTATHHTSLHGHDLPTAISRPETNNSRQEVNSEAEGSDAIGGDLTFESGDGKDSTQTKELVGHRRTTSTIAVPNSSELTAPKQVHIWFMICAETAHWQYKEEKEE